MNKKWLVADKVEQKIVNNFPEIHPVILQLLWSRGLTNQKSIDEFLLPDYSQDVHDPYLFRDMHKAVDRIVKALEKQEKILIYGDYDADGVSSTVLLVDSLQKIGFQNINVYLPDREKEGYGLNSQAIQEIAKDKPDLMITCDCGISNKDEIKLAVNLGIEVIVTDHHCQPPELPRKALAIINPKVEKEKYPFKDLAGVGVAFKLIQALLKDDRIKLENKESIEKWLLDLVALGTVADCMPLLGENRTLVKYGLVVLNKSQRVGLRELIRVAGLDKNSAFGDELKKIEFSLDTYNIAFQLGPRINSAGRMEHALMAYELLISQDKEKAQELAQNLEKTNKERQKFAEKIWQESQKQVGQIEQEQKAIFASGKYDDGWLIGLVGLIAGRLCEYYYLPTIVMSESENEIVGSGRSIEELDIMEILNQSQKFLARFGGHKMACGFALKNKSDLEKFKKHIHKLIKQKLADKKLTPLFFIDAQINLNDITWELNDNLKKFEPFGEDNLKPKFLTKNLTIINLEKVGKDEKHLRLMLSDEQGNIKKFMGFFLTSDWSNKIKIGDKLDVVYELSVNQWNGSQELQQKIIDLKLSDENL
jgi:single-stranded-DNA-specific exonuclease